MLHIKLPKGKVSAACERAAEQATRRIVVANDRYCSDLERWRKDMAPETKSLEWIVNVAPSCLPPARSKDVDLLLQERHTLHQMADMAKHSVGDVYVSPELWNIIKGVY